MSNDMLPYPGSGTVAWPVLAAVLAQLMQAQALVEEIAPGAAGSRGEEA